MQISALILPSVFLIIPKAFEKSWSVAKSNETGTPPSGGLDITSIWCSGDLLELLINYTTTQDIMNEIESKIWDYEKNH